MINDRNLAHQAYVNFLKYEEKQKKIKELRGNEKSAASSTSTGLLSRRRQMGSNTAGGSMDSSSTTQQPIDSVMSIVDMIRNRKGKIGDN